MNLVEASKHFVIDDMGEEYGSILEAVIKNGDEVAPRGMKTKEILGMTLELRDPTRSLAIGCGRKLHAGVAAAEALQLVGGFSDPDAMRQVSPHFSVFQDGGVFHAPYGVRVAPQMPQALLRLRQDQSTRQAVISVWDPIQDLWTSRTRDYPCTTHLQFMLRKGRLDLHVSMRANDAWRGFPYDVFQFSQLQCSLAQVLEREVGTYFHHATSFHLYEQNWNLDALYPGQAPIINGVWGSTWDHVQDRARGLFYGTTEPQPTDEGEARMFNALRKAGVTGSW